MINMDDRIVIHSQRPDLVPPTELLKKYSTDRQYNIIRHIFSNLIIKTTTIVDGHKFKYIYIAELYEEEFARVLREIPSLALLNVLQARHRDRDNNYIIHPEPYSFDYIKTIAHGLKDVGEIEIKDKCIIINDIDITRSHFSSIKGVVARRNSLTLKQGVIYE